MEVATVGKLSDHMGPGVPGCTIINKRGLGLHYLVVQRGISAGHGRL